MLLHDLVDQVEVVVHLGRAEIDGRRVLPPHRFGAFDPGGAEFGRLLLERGHGALDFALDVLRVTRARHERRACDEAPCCEDPDYRSQTHVDSSSRRSKELDLGSPPPVKMT
jgi:hypothetical protein